MNAISCQNLAQMRYVQTRCEEDSRFGFEAAYRRMLLREKVKTAMMALLVIAVMLLACFVPLTYVAVSAVHNAGFEVNDDAGISARLGGEASAQAIPE